MECDAVPLNDLADPRELQREILRQSTLAIEAGEAGQEPVS